MTFPARKAQRRLPAARPGLYAAFCVASLSLPSAPATAFEFEFNEVTGSFDTTLSYGIMVRASSKDKDLIGVANGGRAASVNYDDGTLNYGNGDIASNVAKFTSELDLNYRNFGAFARATGFYDYENQHNNRERTPLDDDAKHLVGKRFRMLDYYLKADLDLGTMPVTLRLGDQVLSWGESTFIQNGINSINHFDASALLLPGGEIREALLPDGMFTASLGITDDISIEGFYQYKWKETEIPPSGSYFGFNDFATEGGNMLFLGSGQVSDLGTQLPAALGGFDATFLGVPRAGTREARNGGQFGVSARLFVPQWNDTEFGFYFAKYHSRTPIISGIAGTAQAAATANRQFVGLVRAGVNPSTAGSVATNTYAQTARYFTEYPEDIKMFGVSWNTDIGTTGIAFQGEASLHHDQPLQIDDAELILATLPPLSFNPAFRDNQIGVVNPNQEISGYIERNVSQLQATLTKVFGPTLGANQLLLIGEAAVTHVHDMPGKNDLRLEAPGTFTSGNPNQSGPGGAHSGIDAEDSKYFADATSYGYRILARLNYDNVFAGINLAPRIAWRHDVHGNTPLPLGNFVEGRKAVTLGVNGTYLEKWSADLSYTNFFGAGYHNLINDRDFLAFNVKYSF
jgi:hypothetical protein